MVKTIKIAQSENDFHQGRELFLEYAGSLGIDLSFQNFSQELSGIEMQYNSPDGALLLVYVNNELAGCVGIRRYATGVSELKRMYVREKFRGLALGKELLEAALRETGKLGYERIRLDTLGTMHAAKKLYEGYGFKQIAPYYENPIPGTVYMEKDLTS
jgi:putative acetyltransferase